MIPAPPGLEATIEYTQDGKTERWNVSVLGIAAHREAWGREDPSGGGVVADRAVAVLGVESLPEDELTYIVLDGDGRPDLLPRYLTDYLDGRGAFVGLADQET